MFSTNNQTGKQSTDQTRTMGKERDVQMSGQNGVASCMMRESCMMNVPVGTAWEAFKTFQFEKMAPSVITSTKFVEGNPAQIGSTYQVNYKDGTKVTYMIVELSELRRKVTIDMIECTPKQSFSSMLTTIKFEKITNDDTTYICWEALFSNDVSADMVKCKKDRVMQLFKDFKSYFEKGEKKF